MIDDYFWINAVNRALEEATTSMAKLEDGCVITHPDFDASDSSDAFIACPQFANCAECKQYHVVILARKKLEDIIEND